MPSPPLPSPFDICLDGSEGKVRNGCFLRRKGSQNHLAEVNETSSIIDGGDRSRAETVWENTRTGKLGQGVVAVETVNLGDGFTTIDRKPESPVVNYLYLSALIIPSSPHLFSYYYVSACLHVLHCLEVVCLP